MKDTIIDVLLSNTNYRVVLSGESYLIFVKKIDTFDNQYWEKPEGHVKADVILAAALRKVMS